MSTVNFTVQNSSGTVLSGATITYSGGNVTTDSGGIGTFTGVVAGTYDFVTTLEGYTAVTTSLTIDGSSGYNETVTLSTSSAASTVVASTTSEVKSGLSAIIDYVDDEVDNLNAEISSTSSDFVKMRDRIEIVFIKGLLAAAIGGSISALNRLAKRYA